MKTNQIMVRGDSRFIQRTKDGYFDANVLLDAFNKEKKGKPLLMANFKATKSTKDYVSFMKEKQITAYYTSNKGTWMHPKMFIDFAMWVSLDFKDRVIDYVLDGLIKSRHDAGDYFNEMCATITETHVLYYGTKPNPLLYAKEARRIKILLGLDKDRNDLTQPELEKITSMQQMNSMLLNDNIGVVSRVKRMTQHAKFLNTPRLKRRFI